MKSFGFGLPYGCEMTLKDVLKKFEHFRIEHQEGAHRTVPGSALNTGDRSGDQGSTPYPSSIVKRVIDL